VRARGDSLWYRSGEFVRRHRTGVTAVALLGVTLVAGVVATTTQARRAEAERAVAEQRVRDVRALAGALLADVHDAITDLPGSLPARAALVRSAITHLDRLHRQSGDDPALEREIAAAYVKLGLVQGNPTVANLGDLAAARRSFDRALAIAESLVAANPRDDAARRTLALAHEKLGDAIAWSGDVPGALSHARLALAAWGRLAAARPASADARRALAMSRIKLGDLLGNPNLPNVSDRAGAMAEYRASLDLLRALPADSLQDWTTRRQLALVHERLGAMLSFDGRHTDAIAELEQSLALRRRLALERSASGNALRDLAVANQLLCETQLARGDDEAAFARCREGMELYHSLHAAEPSNVQSVCDLAVGHQSMHKVLAARGELAASLAHLERSTELVRQVLLTHGDNVPARRDLARGLLYASAVHARLAARPHAPRAERAAHREQAAASYADGERMLLALAERGRLTREDEAFLRDIRSRLDGAPAKE
jgi:tetratricopeptide (TPR) repeat protein